MPLFRRADLKPLALAFFALTALGAVSEARVYSGLEVFIANYTDLVKGKRVGLVTNQTAVDFSRRHIVDVFRADKRINLVALFAPEHGIRGDIPAGKNFNDMRDAKTGLTVYSLYGGQTHRPSKASLDTIDVLVFDMQDVGSRAYTFVWHMAECMSAAAESKKTVIVLDRPNPLGGIVVDGPTTERQFLSFIGLYPVPRVYGMTLGEMACYLNKEEGINCHLIVIPMANYKRGMSFYETGLPWVPPSPNIPSPDSASCFAATGTIGELGTMNIAVGTPLSFQTVCAPWMNAEASAQKLNALKLPGIVFKPVSGPVRKLNGQGSVDLNGVQICITSVKDFKPATTELAVMCHLRQQYQSKFRCLPEKERAFDKAMGTATVRSSIFKGIPWEGIAEKWNSDISAFKAKREKYLMKEYK